MSSLYHFTCIENLPGFSRMQALCSKGTLELAGSWPIPEPGGNDLSHRLDRYNQNWDKVSLNLTPRTPFAYRKKRELHLCFFVISLEPATWDGVVFADCNAASTSDVQRGTGRDGLNLLDFSAVRSRPRPWDRPGWVRPVQAEVLVPNGIPLEYVREVAFVSEASLAEGERLWGPTGHPPFRVSPDIFSDAPGDVTIGFPHVKRIVLTDTVIDKTSVDRDHAHMTRFDRHPGARVTAIASIQALAGTRAEVRWSPVGVQASTEFETSTDYLHWPHILLDQLQTGACSIEYRLNGVRWSTVEFEVV